MSTPGDSIPPLLWGLVDDAAVFPPGNAPLPEAIAAHCQHRAAWYAPLVGPLLLPVGRVLQAQLLVTGGRGTGHEVDLGFPFGTIGGHVPGAAQAELPWSSGLLTEEWVNATIVYAELSREDDWHRILDVMVGTPIAPKFRTGGLSAELFPTTAELAEVLAACRERGLRLKLTAGLHHAARYTDPATGFTHHGFLNILLACLEPGRETDALAVVDPHELAAAIRPHLGGTRPLWASFGTCSVSEPLEDLVQLGIVEEKA